MTRQEFKIEASKYDSVVIHYPNGYIQAERYWVVEEDQLGNVNGETYTIPKGRIEQCCLAKASPNAPEFIFDPKEDSFTRIS